MKQPVAMSIKTTPATAMPTFAPRSRRPELPWWNVDMIVEAFTTSMALVEKTEPAKVRIWPSAGF